MALTEKQKAYYKAYREANREAIRAHQKNWYDKHGAENREQRIETVRENARAYYHRAKVTDRAREYAVANKEKKTEYHAEWQREHRGELNEYNRKRWLKTAKRYQDVVGIPDGEPASSCEICGSTKRICMDHCHEKKIFRGWLCNACNLVADRPNPKGKNRERILAYLERFRLRQVVNSDPR
jgi:hypothetical protein